MDRAEAIAWIEELAADRDMLTAPAAAPAVARLSRVNPTCGDRVDLTLHVDDGLIQLRGSVVGCSLSTAATVVAVGELERLTIPAARPLIGAAVERRLTGANVGPALGSELGGELGELAGLELVPLRRRCVALPWQLIGELLADVHPA